MSRNISQQNENTMPYEKYELELELVKQKLENTKIELKIIMGELSVFTKALDKIISKIENSNNKVSEDESEKRIQNTSLFSGKEWRFEDEPVYSESLYVALNISS